MFLFSKLPGRKGTGPGGWMIQAKLQVYFWLGSIKHKKSYPSGLPPGFQVTNELLNAERPGLPPPISIHYAEKHVSIIFIAIGTQLKQYSFLNLKYLLSSGQYKKDYISI